MRPLYLAVGDGRPDHPQPRERRRIRCIRRGHCTVNNQGGITLGIHAHAGQLVLAGGGPDENPYVTPCVPGSGVSPPSSPLSSSCCCCCFFLRRFLRAEAERSPASS